MIINKYKFIILTLSLFLVNTGNLKSQNLKKVTKWIYGEWQMEDFYFPEGTDTEHDPKNLVWVFTKNHTFSEFDSGEESPRGIWSVHKKPLSIFIKFTYHPSGFFLINFLSKNKMEVEVLDMPGKKYYLRKVPPSSRKFLTDK